MSKQIHVPGLDDLVWRELKRMRRAGRLIANAGDVYRRLRKRLNRRAKRERSGPWDVVAVLGAMLRMPSLGEQ